MATKKLAKKPTEKKKATSAKVKPRWEDKYERLIERHGSYSHLLQEPTGSSEEAVIYGPIVTTPELHMVQCGGAGCYCISDGKWCFKANALSVTVPTATGGAWRFVGAPSIVVVRNNQGSAEWNCLGASDRFFVTTNNPDRIEATVLTSSRSIDIRLACVARFYPPG